MSAKDKTYTENLLRAGFGAGYRATLENMIESLVEWVAAAEAEGVQPLMDARALLADLRGAASKPPPDVRIGFMEPGETPEDFAQRVGLN